MKRAYLSLHARVAIALLITLAPPLAKGDGGVVLLHEVQGPFSVTVFDSREAARGGLTDVSLLVQWRKNGEVVLDADVSLTAEPPKDLAMRSEEFCGLLPSSAVFPLAGMRQEQATVTATREQASNKLLYAANLKLNAPGDWRLHVYVLRGSDSARFDCLLPVAGTPGKTLGLWLYLIFPPIVVSAFAMNQRLRRQSLENGFKSQPPSFVRV
jgi:hypothetical protein